MAKKSAMSKGYRKTVKAKPFLTKKEIIALVVIVIAIIAGVIVVNMVAKAGTIPASKVQSGEIIGFASAEMRDRYVKLGTVNEVEGFTMEGGATVETPTASYNYTPVEQGDYEHTFSVSTSVYDASTAADSIMGNYFSYGLTDLSEKFETTVYGLPAYVFGVKASYYDETQAAEEETVEEPAEEAAEETAEEPAEEAAEEATEEVAEDAAVEETPADNVFTQSITMYIDAGEDHAIAIHSYLNGTDDSFYIPDDQLVDHMMPLTAAVNPLNAVAE